MSPGKTREFTITSPVLGRMAQAEVNGPHRDCQPALFILEAAGGKLGLGFTSLPHAPPVPCGALAVIGIPAASMGKVNNEHYIV
jgi:hypothetical protein